MPSGQWGTRFLNQCSQNVISECRSNTEESYAYLACHCCVYPPPHGDENPCRSGAALFERGGGVRTTCRRGWRRSCTEAAQVGPGQLPQMGHRRSQAVADRNPVLPVRARLWHGDFLAAKKPARASVDARNL